MPATNKPKQSPMVPRQGNLIIPPSDKDDRAKLRRSRPKTTSPRPAGWLAYIALILLTVGSYFPIFSSETVWSPYDEVERSPFASMESWHEAWAPQMIRSEDPLTLTSYFIEQQIPLPAAATQHAINLFLHIVAAILLLKVLEALKLPAAFSAALVFALHPAVLQTIFWSGYRSELVGLILVLATLLFGIRNRSAKDFVCLIAFSIAAYALHPAALVIPLLLGLCIFHQNTSVHLKHYNRLLPLLCLALFLGVWTQGDSSVSTMDLSDRLNVSAQNLFFYLKQSLLPIDLSLFHPFDQGKGYSVGAQNSFLPFLLFIPFYVLIAINYKKPWARGLLLGLTGYLLLVIYGLSQTGAFIDGSMAHEDHLQYIALPAIIAVVICTAGGIVRKMGSAGKYLWYLGFTVFAAFQMVITSTFAYNVSDRTQMWQTLSEEWPDAWQPKLALIETIRDSKKESDLLADNEMVNMLKAVLEQQPDRIKERILLAQIYRNVGQNANALRQYKRILRDSQPSNEFLKETVDFYEKLGLTWDANNARMRITE